MKSSNYFWATLFACLLLENTSLQGQICSPDTSISTFGIFPQDLPDMCLNTFQSENITIWMPVEATVEINGNIVLAAIDSFVIEGITGLPPGLNYTCQPPFCQTTGGGSSCLLLSGTPNQLGTYVMDIYVSYYAHVNDIQVVEADTFWAYYEVVINDFSAQSAVQPARCGNADGQVSVTFNGTAPYTYLWNNGNTTATLSGIPPGQYSVVASDANSCIFSDTLVVPSIGEAPQISIENIGWEGCLEDGEGVIDLDVDGGRPAYLFSWSNGAQTEDLRGLAEGIYTLELRDADNCLTRESFQIIEPPSLDLGVLIQTNVLCAGGQTGSVSALVSGGIEPYTLSWNTQAPVSTAILNSLGAGTYTLTVRDTANCLKTLDITITEPPALQVDFVTHAETSAGAMDGGITATVSGGYAPYEYLWNNGEIGKELDSLSNGSYTLKVKDAYGCMLVDSVNLDLWAVGIKEELDAGVKFFTVSPNPSQGKVSIDLELTSASEIEVQIFDLQGKTHFSEKQQITQKFSRSFDLSTYGPGLYLLSLNTSSGTINRKVLIR